MDSFKLGRGFTDRGFTFPSTVNRGISWIDMPELSIAYWDHSSNSANTRRYVCTTFNLTNTSLMNYLESNANCSIYIFQAINLSNGIIISAHNNNIGSLDITQTNILYRMVIIENNSQIIDFPQR